MSLEQLLAKVESAVNAAEDEARALADEDPEWMGMSDASVRLLTAVDRARRSLRLGLPIGGLDLLDLHHHLDRLATAGTSRTLPNYRGCAPLLREARLELPAAPRVLSEAVARQREEEHAEREARMAAVEAGDSQSNWRRYL